MANGEVEYWTEPDPAIDNTALLSTCPLKYKLQEADGSKIDQHPPDAKDVSKVYREGILVHSVVVCVARATARGYRLPMTHGYGYMAIQDTKVNSPLGSLPHRLPLLLKADYCLYLGKDAVAWSGGGRFATSNFNLNCLVELETNPSLVTI
jgi:hypothetical protein